MGAFPTLESTEQDNENLVDNENDDTNFAFGAIEDISSDEDDQGPNLDKIEHNIYNNLNRDPNEESDDYETEEYDDFPEDSPHPSPFNNNWADEYEQLVDHFSHSANLSSGNPYDAHGTVRGAVGQDGKGSDYDLSDDEDQSEFNIMDYPEVKKTDFKETEFLPDCLPLGYFCRVKINEPNEERMNLLIQAMSSAARKPYKGMGTVHSGAMLYKTSSVMPGYLQGYSYFIDIDWDDYDWENRNDPEAIKRHGTFVVKINQMPFFTEQSLAKKPLRESICTGSIRPMMQAYLEIIKKQINKYELFGPADSGVYQLEDLKLEIISLIAVQKTVGRENNSWTKMFTENEEQKGYREIKIEDIEKDEYLLTIKKCLLYMVGNFQKIAHMSGLYTNKYWNS